MLANRLIGCQSPRRCVRVCVLLRPVPAVVIPCSFGLSPKFSTPVEKSVENRILAEMNLWDEILARIETKVNRHSFYTWFRPTTFVSEDRSSVTVRVPNALFKDW